MFRFIDYAVGHSRLTIATLIFLLLAGLVAYVTIPKEAEPDVRIPIIYVQLSQRGISPEDSERLLLRPVETQLKSVGNVKEMRSTAFEGGGFNPSVRYFLPIYPALVLFGAMLSVEAGRWLRQRTAMVAMPQLARTVLPAAILLICTASWAWAFTRIYARPHSRIAAAHW